MTPADHGDTELIRQLGKERTVILSSHILSEVQQVCTTILILSKGKLVACDTPENLERLFAGKSTVELTVEAAEKEIPGILSGVSHIVNRTARRRQDGACDVTLELDIPAENEVCREIFFAFSKAGKAILRMTAGKASLEDIFMELTDSEKGRKPNESSIPARAFVLFYGVTGYVFSAFCCCSRAFIPWSTICSPPPCILNMCLGA